MHHIVGAGFGGIEAGTESKFDIQAVECGYSFVLRFAIEVQAPLELRSYWLFFTSGTSAKGCEHRIKYNQIK